MVLGASPVQAGTEANPEVTDPAADQGIEGQSVDEAGFAAADIIAGWVGNETATAINFYVKASANINGGNVQGQAATTQYTYNFHFTVKGGADYVATASVLFDAKVTPSGAAKTATVAGSILTLTVLKADIGNPAAGAVIEKLFIDSAVTLPPATQVLVRDRAPNADTSTTVYVVTGGGSSGTGGGGLPGDKDADGLQDTFEKQYFGNDTSPQTGSGDPDSDGLNNTREQALGTDPTKADTDGDGVKDGQEATDGTDPKKADTDGDGVSDGDEKKAGSDPKDPASKPATQTSSSTTSRATTTTSSSTTTSSTSSDEGGDLDVGYLGASVVAAVILTILGLVAIFGRWGA